MEAESSCRCNDHPNEDVIMLCSQCKSLICSACCSSTHAGHKFQSLKTFTEVLENQAKADLGKLAKNPKASNIIESPMKKNSRTSVLPESMKIKSGKPPDLPENPKKRN